MAQALNLGVAFVSGIHALHNKKKKFVIILSPLLPASTYQESLKEKATEAEDQTRELLTIIYNINN